MKIRFIFNPVSGRHARNARLLPVLRAFIKARALDAEIQRPGPLEREPRRFPQLRIDRDMRRHVARLPPGVEHPGLAHPRRP